MEGNVNILGYDLRFLVRSLIYRQIPNKVNQNLLAGWCNVSLVLFEGYNFTHERAYWIILPWDKRLGNRINEDKVFARIKDITSKKELVVWRYSHNPFLD